MDALAGISVTSVPQYTLIEQGREISVSRGLLEKIADAFGLDAIERADVRSLLLERPDVTLVVNTPWPGTDTSERLLRLVNAQVAALEAV